MHCVRVAYHHQPMDNNPWHRALQRAFSRPYLWLWALWILGMASFGFGVLYTSSSYDYLVEIIIYISFLAVPPPVIIMAYAYVVESRLTRVASITDLSADGNDAATCAFVEKWSQWVEANTKKGKVSSLVRSSDELPDTEQSVCPICIDEMQQDEDARKLPCGHMMHLWCFDVCFTKHFPHYACGKQRHQCPLCREAFGPPFVP